MVHVTFGPGRAYGLQCINSIVTTPLYDLYDFVFYLSQTLCALLKATFQKKLSDRSFDVIDIIVGFDSAECQMRVCDK